MVKIGDIIKEKITRTKNTKIPCIWEEGTKKDTKGYSSIVATELGMPKRAMYICRESLQKKHALLPVTIGDYIIKAFLKMDSTFIMILKIEDLSLNSKHESEFAECKVVALKNNTKWFGLVPEHLNNAIESAINKAGEENCKRIYFAKNDTI